MKKFVVEILKFGQPNAWETESEFDTYEEAKKRAIELVGVSDYQSDQITEKKYVVPEAPFVWNGLIYENKETGETKKGEDKILFSLEEGYFGRKESDFWTCRIIVKE